MHWTPREITLDCDRKRGARVFELTHADGYTRHRIEVCSFDDTSKPDEAPHFTARSTPHNNAALFDPFLELAIALRANDHKTTLNS